MIQLRMLINSLIPRSDCWSCGRWNPGYHHPCGYCVDGIVFKVRCLAVLLEGRDASKTKHHGCDNLVILITEKGYIIKHGISRKRKSRAETPALDVANVSYGKVTKAEDNELTVIQTNEKDNEKKPNPKNEQKQKGEELEQETEENNKLTVVQTSEDGDEKKPNTKKELKQKGKETEQETEEEDTLVIDNDLYGESIKRPMK